MLLLSALCIIVLACSMTFAFGITPAHAETTFVPGDEFVNRFSVVNDENLVGTIHVSVEGELADLVVLEQNDMTLGSGMVSVPYVIKFPNNVPPGGEYVVKLFAEPKVGSQGSVAGATVRLAHKVTIKVPYHGKAISVDADVNDAGTRLDLLASVRNVGAEDIKVLSATFNLYDANNESSLVLTTKTQSRSLLVGEKGLFNLSFDASKLLPGTYVLRAVIDYDGSSDEATHAYTRGVPMLDLVSIPAFVVADELSPFNVVVRNAWNEEMKGVFADVDVVGSGGIVRSFRTESLDIGARQQAVFSPFFDARGLPVSKVGVVVRLHPDKGRMQEYNASIDIVTKTDYETINATLAPAPVAVVEPIAPMVVLVLTLILLIYTIIWYLRGRPPKVAGAGGEAGRVNFI
jgi:hypothetical protein